MSNKIQPFVDILSGQRLSIRLTSPRIWDTGVGATLDIDSLNNILGTCAVDTRVLILTRFFHKIATMTRMSQLRLRLPPPLEVRTSLSILESPEF